MPDAKVFGERLISVEYWEEFVVLIHISIAKSRLPSASPWATARLR